MRFIECAPTATSTHTRSPVSTLDGVVRGTKPYSQLFLRNWKYKTRQETIIKAMMAG